MKTHILYIAGISYSGSTILGVLIGSSSKVFNIGEIKLIGRNDANFYKNKHHLCSCGLEYTNCSFWSKVKIEEFNFFKKPTIKEKISILMHVLFNAKINTIRKSYQETEFLEAIKGNADQYYREESRYLIDGSKGIWRLVLLNSNPDIDLTVIHLVRNIFSNAKSFKKHEGSFCKGCIFWLIHHSLIKLYLYKNKIKTINVSYSDLCKNSGSNIKRLNSKLKIDINASEYIDKIKERKYHIIGGNPLRYKYGKNFDQFEGITKGGHNKDSVRHFADRDEKRASSDIPESI